VVFTVSVALELLKQGGGPLETEEEGGRERWTVYMPTAAVFGGIHHDVQIGMGGGEESQGCA
jgi:hypothetical protein